MDGHNYVKVVVHGFKEVSAEERLATYCDSSKVGTTLYRERVSSDGYVVRVSQLIYFASWWR